MKLIFLCSVVFHLIILLSGERKRINLDFSSLLLEVEGRGFRGGIIIIGDDGYRDIQIVYLSICNIPSTSGRVRSFNRP